MENNDEIIKSLERSVNYLTELSNIQQKSIDGLLVICEKLQDGLFELQRGEIERISPMEQTSEFLDQLITEPFVFPTHRVMFRENYYAPNTEFLIIPKHGILDVFVNDKGMFSVKSAHGNSEFSINDVDIIENTYHV